MQGAGSELPESSEILTFKTPQQSLKFSVFNIYIIEGKINILTAFMTKKFLLDGYYYSKEPLNLFL